jgi:hypothetical protein
MAKRLSYDDDDDGSAFTQHVPEGLAGLAPLLELPHPDDAASSIFVSAPSHDAIAASARSADAQVSAARSPLDSDSRCSSSSG